jgi:hypothetical protein
MRRSATVTAHASASTRTGASVSRFTRCRRSSSQERGRWQTVSAGHSLGHSATERQATTGPYQRDGQSDLTSEDKPCATRWTAVGRLLFRRLQVRVLPGAPKPPGQRPEGLVVARGRGHAGHSFVTGGHGRDPETVDLGLARHGLHVVMVADAGQRTAGRPVPEILLMVSGPGRGGQPRAAHVCGNQCRSTSVGYRLRWRASAASRRYRSREQVCRGSGTAPGCRRRPEAQSAAV